MGKYNLSGVRQEAKPQQAERTEAPAPAKKVAPPAAREPGKRSTPGFIRTTVYMREETKLKANRRLQDLKDERDLSELIESLVAGWVSEHSNV
jgi:hypothetical protein